MQLNRASRQKVSIKAHHKWIRYPKSWSIVHQSSYRESIFSSNGRALCQSAVEQHRQQEIRRNVTRRKIKPPSLYSDIKLAMKSTPVILDWRKSQWICSFSTLAAAAGLERQGNGSWHHTGANAEDRWLAAARPPSKSHGVPEEQSVAFQQPGLVGARDALHCAEEDISIIQY